MPRPIDGNGDMINVKERFWYKIFFEKKLLGRKLLVLAGSGRALPSGDSDRLVVISFFCDGTYGNPVACSGVRNA